ncbi:hypothetical protein ACWN6X_03850, partial [Weissella thailandensis]
MTSQLCKGLKKSATKVVLKLVCNAFTSNETKNGWNLCRPELNPVSWSNFQNLRGFTMFSKEVQIEAVTMYLQGIPPYKIR